jgi:hypothetical protein
MSQPVPIKEQLIDLFNARLLASGITTEYAEEDLTFGDPEAYDPETLDPAEPEGANTSILVTAGEGLEEIQYRLHYCRLDLARLASIRADEIEIDGSPTSTHDLLEELSAHVKFELTEDDLSDELIEDDVVTLIAEATSLAVIGQASFTLVDNVQE